MSLCRIRTTIFAPSWAKSAPDREEAAWELVQEYGDALSPGRASGFERDVAAEVRFAGFCANRLEVVLPRPNKLDQFDTPRELVNFLTTVALNKIRDEARRLMAEHSDHRRELVSDEAHLPDVDALVDPRPAPVDVAIAREQWDRMLQSLPTHYRELIQMRLQGHTYEEIGAVFHLDRGAARRLLHRLLGKIPASHDADRFPKDSDSAARANRTAKPP